MARNVMFLMTDQHRVDTLGCYGNPHVQTPHLDALAATGTRFDRCYTPTAICTPARASLLTGQAPFRHRLLANYERNVGYLEDLPDDAWTLASALGEAGYNRGLIGKWHVGTRRSAKDYGFDGPTLPGWHNPVNHPDYVAYLDQRSLPRYEISEPIRGTFPNQTPGNLLAARLHQPVEATFEYYLATRTIEMLRRYADEYRSGRPFYLATHFFGPHLPYLLPEEYFDAYDPDLVELPLSVNETFANKPPVQHNYSALWAFDTLPLEVTRKLVAVYWGYVALIDQQVGRILGALDELGLTDETAVFFTSDHGEFTGAHRLHDKGPAMYEDIYRIPSIIRVPGAPAGQVRQEFTSLIDCTATILDLAGLDPAAAVDGRSLLPLVQGGEVAAWRSDIVCEFHGHHFPHPQRMLRTSRFKLVVNPESRNELYDLEADPDELVNRHDDTAFDAVRRDLSGRLYRQLRDRGDNFYHWMTAMSDIGGRDYDHSLSVFEPDGPTTPSTPGPDPRVAVLRGTRGGAW